jgi:hypothetical protein
VRGAKTTASRAIVRAYQAVLRESLVRRCVFQADGRAKARAIELDDRDRLVAGRGRESSDGVRETGHRGVLEDEA